MKVIMTGWEEGMKKVSLSMLQTECLGLPLKEAKSNVDRLLAGEEVELHIVTLEKAQNFVKEARSLGVVCKIVR